MNFQDRKKAVIDYDRESKELANVDFKEKFNIYATRIYRRMKNYFFIMDIYIGLALFWKKN